MKSAFRLLVFVIVLAVALMTAGCGATQELSDTEMDAAGMGAVAVTTELFRQSVRAIGPAQTLTGMQNAIREYTGTFMMTKGDLFILAWEHGQRWAFTVLTKNGNPADTIRSMGLVGQKVDTLTMANVTKFLEQTGWEYISSSQLPEPIRTTILGGTATSLLSTLKAAFFIFPAGTYDDFMEKYGQVATPWPQ